MKLQWTVPAVDDLECIRNYIARDSEPYAAGFVEKILAAIIIFSPSPAEEPEKRGPGLNRD